MFNFKLFWKAMCISLTVITEKAGVSALKVILRHENKMSWKKLGSPPCVDFSDKCKNKRGKGMDHYCFFCTVGFFWCWSGNFRVWWYMRSLYNTYSRLHTLPFCLFAFTCMQRWAFACLMGNRKWPNQGVENF